MNLPNALTIIRIFLIPLLIVVLFFEHEELIGTLIFSVAVVTDWLDGHIARKRNQVTNFGILFDPIADKLLISAAFISLAGLKKVEAWIVVILVGRELVVTTLRIIVAMDGHFLAAEKLGKLKFIAQVIAIIIFMSNISFLNRYYVGDVALYFSLILSIVSATKYFMDNWQRIALTW